MNSFVRSQSFWLKALLVFAIWTTLGLVDAGQSYFYSRVHSQEDPLPLWAALLGGISDWYLWALFTPLIVWMALRWPLERRHWNRVLLHGVSSLATSMIVIAIILPIFRFILTHGHRATPCDMTDGQLFHMLVTSKLVVYVVTHWLIVGVAHGLLYYNKYQERALQASNLETQLAQTQLQMLKMQLHPHFLFNTLHAISALMHRDVDIADRMLAQLGQLLRTTLENAGTQEVPLRQEIEFIQPYLEIEKARLGARLTVHMHIDPEVLDAQVPNLLLQPLVENAIRHGIAPRTTPGVIEVSARRQDKELLVEIRDNGPGLPPGPGGNVKEGVGVGNTRARLKHLYGEQHRFEMCNAGTGGLIVRVFLPYREASLPVNVAVAPKTDITRDVNPDLARWREKLRPLVKAESN